MFEQTTMIPARQQPDSGMCHPGDWQLTRFGDGYQWYLCLWLRDNGFGCYSRRFQANSQISAFRMAAGFAETHGWILGAGTPVRCVRGGGSWFGRGSRQKQGGR